MRLRLGALALAGVLALALGPASARDLGQWSHIDPKIRACFHDLRSPEGGFCCDGADGVKIEDPDWHDNQDGTYSVTLDGVAQRIDVGHVTNAGTCGARYAIAWTYIEWDGDKPKHKVRCFSPGTRG